MNNPMRRRPSAKEKRLRLVQGDDLFRGIFSPAMAAKELRWRAEAGPVVTISASFARELADALDPEDPKT